MAEVTLDDIFSKAPSCGGRATNAIIEAKDLIEKWLPPVLQRVNSESNVSIPAPAGYYIAGTPIQQNFPIVVVGFSVETSNQALRVDQDHVSIAMYFAFQKIESEAQILSCLEGVTWMRNIIMAHRGARFNAAGLPCWKGLEPGSFSRAPQKFTEYEGLAYQFRAWQPGDKTDGRSYWNPPT